MSQASTLHLSCCPKQKVQITPMQVNIYIGITLVSFDDPPIKLKADDTGMMCFVCGTMAKIDWLLPGDLNGDFPRGHMVT